MPDLLPDKFRGCLLGGAVGDALGHETEFMGLAGIRGRFGERGVTGFERWGTAADGRRVALYTDDTQMAECVARTLVAAGREPQLDRAMDDLAKRFITWGRHPQGGHRAPGNACMAGCRALEDGVPWQQAGGPAAGGCGSVMRVAPVGLRFWNRSGLAEEYAVAQSRPTHNDPIALAASAAMAAGVAAFVRGEDDATAWRLTVEAAGRHDANTADMIRRALAEAADPANDSDATFDRLRGWAAHEAIAGGVYAAARHPGDFRAAVLLAANTPGDSDSLACLAGNLLGARNGLAGIPEEWVRDVERSAELLALADELAEVAQ